MINNAEQLTQITLDWMEKARKNAHAQGYVLGLSGGIDSSTVACLCQKTKSELLGIIMPCESDTSDKEAANLLIQKFNIPYLEIDLTKIFKNLIENFKIEAEKMAAANLKARLRMTVLYFFANQKNLMVAGAGNYSEKMLGYFTKYGDGGVDISPLAGLYKSEVYELAEYLKIPQKILEKTPSAGLWPGQEDEKELGLSYKTVETSLRDLERVTGGNIIEKIQEDKTDYLKKGQVGYNKVIEYVVKSVHKNQPPISLTRKMLLKTKCLE